MTNKDAIEFLKNMISQEGGRAIGASDFMLELCGYHVTALRMGIKALEYDDAKYHEEHGEVVVDKAVWEDAKKALEQEPCEDAISGKVEQMIHLEGREASKALQAGEYISREAVIDIIEDVCPIYGNDYRYILREEINELPSVTIPSADKWIPVSERLPEKNMRCLVAVGRFNFTQIAMYSDLMGIIDHQIFYQGYVGHDSFENITQHVKAWMPLPKPYEPQERSE